MNNLAKKKLVKENVYKRIYGIWKGYMQLFLLCLNLYAVKSSNFLVEEKIFMAKQVEFLNKIMMHVKCTQFDCSSYKPLAAKIV